MGLGPIQSRDEPVVVYIILGKGRMSVLLSGVRSGLVNVLISCLCSEI